jgi:hypothetical protein
MRLSERLSLNEIIGDLILKIKTIIFKYHSPLTFVLSIQLFLFVDRKYFNKNNCCI